MISIRLNGKEKQLEGSVTLTELLSVLDIPTLSIAVAINDEIIPRSEFDKKKLQDRDEVEIIHPVGGG